LRASLPANSNQVTRLQQFSRGLGSSWLATAATVTYSLLSVPIALRYLSVEEFGLFVLLIQIAAYFTLVEIGMSAASARILVDYKDHRDGGAYGSVILTGLLVFAIQGFVILAVGVLAAPWIISLVGVPSALAEVATLLLRWMAFTSALTLAFRIYGSVLYANKRLDLVYGFMGVNMLFGLVLLAMILAGDGGLEGLRWLFLAQAIITILLPILACNKLELLPKQGCWGLPSMSRFRELFGFGKDIFLVNVGNQVLEASQLIIVTRTMGLTAAAIWSVSTKLFTLVYQLVTKIEGTAIVFFAEMMVRGEKEKLAARFRQIYQLTAGIAVVALATVVAINAPFVSVWANPSLAWSLPLSGLFAVVVALNALTRCSGDLIIHTKNIAAFRYVYFLEAAIFVLFSLWLSTHFGFYGILGASIVCLLVFRATYTSWRMAHYFQVSVFTFWWTWLKRPFLAAIILLPFVISSSWLANSVTNLWGQLLLAVAWVGLPATIVLLFVALPRDIRKEFTQRLPQFSSIAKY
jgi:O-antigen/teichoic acid export membrane protein